MLKNTISWIFLGNCLNLLVVLSVYAEDVMLAVASNFSPVMQSLIPEFKSNHARVNVILISGSSGKLFAQIVHGAPYDIFLSADSEKPSRLVSEGLALASSQFTYAFGQLVLWSRDPLLVNSDAGALLSGKFDKLAIANSKLAPYGLAAEQVLLRLGMLESTRKNWVQGENIAQTFQFVQSGNASLGFVARSQVFHNGQLSHGSVWIIPDDYYQPIRQDGVILTRSMHKESARLLMDFLKQDNVRAKIASFGYKDVPIENLPRQDK